MKKELIKLVLSVGIASITIVDAGLKMAKALAEYGKII